MTSLELAAILLGLLLGGVLKGGTGIGAPFVAIPAIAAVTDIREAIVIMLVPTVVTNIWQAWAFRHELRPLAFLRPMVGAAILGMFLGTWALVVVPVSALSLLLCAIIVLYIGFRLSRPAWVLSRQRADALALPVGAAAGLLQGAAGLSGPVSVTFLSAMRLPRPQFAGSMATLFLASTLAQAVALWWAGLLEPRLLGQSVLALLPIAIGMALGAWSARFVSPETFQRLILAILAILALKLLWDGLA